MITFDKYVKPDKLIAETFKEFNKDPSTELSKQLDLFKYIMDSLELSKIDNVDKQHFSAIYNAINKENFDIAKKATREEKAILSYAGLGIEDRLTLLAILSSSIKGYMIKAVISCEGDFKKHKHVVFKALDKKDDIFRYTIYTWEQRFHPVLAQAAIGVQTLYNRAAALLIEYEKLPTFKNIEIDSKALKINTNTMNKLVNAETIQRKVEKSNEGINYITDKIYDESGKLIGYTVEARIPSSKSKPGYITTFRGTVNKAELKEQIKRYPNRYINATLTSDNRIVIKKNIGN